jgi:hypothetical protein
MIEDSDGHEKHGFGGGNRMMEDQSFIATMLGRISKRD